MKNTPFFLVLLIGLTGCYRSDIQEVNFTIPKLTSEDCSRYVLEALSKQEGIKEAQPDLMSGTLIVKYNARVTALKNIEYAIAEAGFDVNEEKGREKAKARLPDGCK